MHDLSLKKAYWINGENQEMLTITDRGLQYGDGFFTTIAVVNFSILNWSAHWHRIMHSCTVLQLLQPEESVLLKQLSHAIKAFLQANDCQDCVLKILLTRGTGGKAYAAPIEPKLNKLFYFKALAPSAKALLATDQKALHNTEFEIGVSSIMASTNAFQGVKTLNRLENVLARTEAVKNGWQEAIMLDQHQQVVCGTQSNIFAIKNNQVMTPPILHSGVVGTTRWQLIPLLEKLGFSVEEKALELDDLETADELFFTNAVAGIQAVTRLNKSVFHEHSVTYKITELWNSWQKQHAIKLQK